TTVRTQAINIQPELPIMRDMSAETMKMPEPIITPTTTMVESNRLRPRTKVRSAGLVVVGCVMAWVSESVCGQVTTRRGGRSRRDGVAAVQGGLHPGNRGGCLHCPPPFAVVAGPAGIQRSARVDQESDHFIVSALRSRFPRVPPTVD